MNINEFANRLELAFNKSTSSTLRDVEADYWKLLDLLDTLDPGKADKYRDNKGVLLALRGAEMFQEDAQSFPRLCRGEARTALKHVARQWTLVDPLGFKGYCKMAPGEALALCPQVWYEQDMDTFLEKVKVLDLAGNVELQTILRTNHLDMLVTLLRRTPKVTLDRAGKLWSEIDEENFLLACLYNPGFALSNSLETALAWKTLDPLNYEIALARHLDKVVAVSPREHSGNFETGDQDWIASLDLNEGFIPRKGRYLAPGLIQDIALDRPDLAASVIPYLKKQQDEPDPVRKYAHLWNEVDQKNFHRNAGGDRWALPGLLSQLDERGKLGLLQYLEDHDRLPFEWTSSTMRDGGDLLVDVLLAAWREGNESEVARIKDNIVELARKSNELGTGGSLADCLTLDEDVIEAFQENPEQLRELFRLIPEYPWMLVQRVENSLEELNKSYGWTADTLQYAGTVMRALEENGDIILENQKEQKTAIKGTQELLITVALNKQQQQDLVLWCVETPGQEMETLTWCSQRVGNLPKPPARPKVTVRKTRPITEGRTER